MIETPRLHIRSFREEDWQAVHAYSTDPEVVRYVPGEISSEAETRAAIHSWMNGPTDDPPHYDFAVTVRPVDFVIGWCCIQISSSDMRLGELMFVFNRIFWGQGYAIEAAHAIVNYGFSELKLHRIFATCRPENIRSWRILEKLGMRREGLLRENTWIRGSWHNSYLYGIDEFDRLLAEVEPCHNCEAQATSYVIVKYHHHHRVEFSLCEGCAQQAHADYSRKGGVSEVVVYPLSGQGRLKP